jgi:hypothetical protein
MTKKTWLYAALILSLLAGCKPLHPATPTVDAPGTFTAVANTLSIGFPTQAPASATPAPSALPTATRPVVTGFPTVQIISTQTNTLYPYISWTPSKCDKLTFVSDLSVPDDTKFYPGTKFTKKWKVYNSGTCAWTKDYRLTYISGNKMGADTINLDKTVSPGEYAEFSIDMTAPDTPEDYSNYWRLRNPTGLIFGDTLYVVIEVSKSASTLTLTGTLTTTASVTATPTFTATATTPAVTAPVPTATNTPSPTTAVPTTAVPPPTDTVVPSDTPVPTVESTAVGG